MEQYFLKPIGRICWGQQGAELVVEQEYIPGLTNLEGFGYIQVLWWFHQSDDAASRSSLTEQSPYKDGPEVLGTFATRSPQRPNPIGLSCAEVLYIDHQRGAIGLAYIDAEDGTPVLDIKPYTPSLDRVENPATPDWCAHWPQSVESSGDFDWESVFQF